jgi:hypothetical protein
MNLEPAAVVFEKEPQLPEKIEVVIMTVVAVVVVVVVAVVEA